jgi:dihydroorotase
VFDQATTMAKFLHLGFDLPDVVRLSTISPAELIKRDDEIGSLEPGKCADVTLFRVVDGQFDLSDAEGNVERAERTIQAAGCVRAGKVVTVNDVLYCEAVPAD